MSTTAEASRLTKKKRDDARKLTCPGETPFLRLVDKITFLLMYDQDRAGSISGNLLGLTTGHQPPEPRIVMRRHHDQVGLQQLRQVDYLRARISDKYRSLDLSILLLDLLNDRVQFLFSYLK